jgi:hypothetical protein|tara:strand:- start:7895 stop:8095 length:201 start_codon:yes stop_codon:yes gene_type:complete
MGATIKVYMTRDGRSIYKIDGLPDFECEDLTKAIKVATGDKDAKVVKTESLQAGGGGDRSESIHRG